MSREDPHFKLRIPAALKQRVETVAAESGRSMTAEINYRIEASFEIVEKLSAIDAKIDHLLALIGGIEKLPPKA